MPRIPTIRVSSEEAARLDFRVNYGPHIIFDINSGPLLKIYGDGMALVEGVRSWAQRVYDLWPNYERTRSHDPVNALLREAKLPESVGGRAALYENSRYVRGLALQHARAECPPGRPLPVVPPDSAEWARQLTISYLIAEDLPARR